MKKFLSAITLLTMVAMVATAQPFYPPSYNYQPLEVLSLPTIDTCETPGATHFKIAAPMQHLDLPDYSSGILTQATRQQPAEPPCVFYSKSAVSHYNTLRTIGAHAKYGAPVLATLSGIAGGLGERWLSKDGNWDTRSARSHLARDLGLWGVAATGASFAIGFQIDATTINPKTNKSHFRMGEFLLHLVNNAACYYIGTRVGYALGK